MTTALGLLFIGIMIMAVGLMTLAYFFKRPALALGAAGAWIIIALLSYGVSATAWDIYFGIFWFSILMVIISAFEAYYAKEKQLTPEEPKDSWDDYADDMEKRSSRYDKIKGMRKGGRKPKQSNYAKTGKP